MQKKFCLIVPCYQEAERLRRLTLTLNDDIVFIFVDDGSKDETVAVLKTILRPEDTIVRLPINQGKAEAVRQGMLHSLSYPPAATCSWIGFWDADFATPVSELPYFDAFAANYSQVGSIWGSRVYRSGATIERKFMRHLLGRLFATVAKLFLGLETYDSQCGAKLFSRELVNPLFQEPFVSRWLFDVELYFRLKKIGAPIIEYPLRQWRDIKGGQLKINKVFVRTLVDLWKIKKHYQ